MQLLLIITSNQMPTKMPAATRQQSTFLLETWNEVCQTTNLLTLRSWKEKSDFLLILDMAICFHSHRVILLPRMSNPMRICLSFRKADRILLRRSEIREI